MEQERTLSRFAEIAVAAGVVPAASSWGNVKGKFAERGSGSNGVGSLRDGSPPGGEYQDAGHGRLEPCSAVIAVLQLVGGWPPAGCQNLCGAALRSGPLSATLASKQQCFDDGPIEFAAPPRFAQRSSGTDGQAIFPNRPAGAGRGGRGSR
jgi:hypothetical protein